MADALHGKPPTTKPLDPKLLQPLIPPGSKESSLLSTFLVEYGKLQQALSKSHDGEERFAKRCRTLLSQIETQTEQITSTEAARKSTETLIENLKATIEDVRAAQEEAKADRAERERAKQRLAEEIKTLHEDMDTMVDQLREEQLVRVGEVENQIEQVARVRDRERGRLNGVMQKNVALGRQLDELEQKRTVAEEELNRTRTAIAEVGIESRMAESRKGELERKKSSMQDQVSALKARLRKEDDMIKKAEADLVQVRDQVSLKEAAFEELRAEQVEHERTVKMLEATEMAARSENEQMLAELSREQKTRGAEERELQTAQREVKKLKRQVAKAQERIAGMNREHAQVEETKRSLLATINDNKEKLAEARKRLKRVTKQLDTSVREREVLNQSHVAKHDATQRQRAVLKISSSALRNVRNEYESYMVTIRDLSRVIDRLRREKAGHEVEFSRRRVQNAKIDEEASVRDQLKVELKHKIDENEARCRQQQALLDDVKMERNKYRKIKVKQKADMKAFRTQFANLTMQISQLKQDVAAKDIAFVKEHVYLQHVKEDYSVLQAQNEAHAEEVKELESILAEQNAQIVKLSAVIADADEELKAQTKQYNEIVHEQRLLSQQLIERNQELAKLYDRLKLQHSLIRQGNAQYRDKMKAISKLKQAQDRLQMQLDSVSSDHGKYHELQATIEKTKQELVKEQLKVSALNVELGKSINIHRWHQLEDTDKNTMKLIERVQQLQRALIKRAQAVERKDKEIEEQERLYVQLRRVLARQPGQEAVAQMEMYEETVKKKRNKLKAIRADMEAQRAAVGEYEYELDKLKQAIQLLKLDYFAARRREMVESRRSMQESRGLSSGAWDRGDMPQTFDEEADWDGLVSGRRRRGISSADPAHRGVPQKGLDSDDEDVRPISPSSSVASGRAGRRLRTPDEEERTTAALGAVRPQPPASPNV